MEDNQQQNQQNQQQQNQQNQQQQNQQQQQQTDPAPKPAGDSEHHTAREAELEQQLEKLKSDFEALKAENQKLFVMNRPGDNVQDQSNDPNYNAKQFILNGFNPEYLFKE